MCCIERRAEVDANRGLGMWTLVLFLCLTLVAGACGGDDDDDSTNTTPSSTQEPAGDQDQDGYAVEDGDCNDSDPAIHPEATEICDESATDENCNGLADDEDPTVDPASQQSYYPDADGDGYGDSSSAGTSSCTPLTELVNSNNDCDDSDPTVNPAATEVCDEADFDENCNGFADDLDFGTSADGKVAYYHDADQDGFGDATSVLTLCDDPSTETDWWNTDGSDCNDRDATIYPGAEELCDEIDQNCNLQVDEGAAVDASTWVLDADSDGYGGEEEARACEKPEGYSDVSGDCNDGDADIHPGALERCDDADTDEDCNGLADNEDEGAETSSQSTFYPDADEDGYGDANNEGVKLCDIIEGYTTDASDCDDSDPAFNPAAPAEGCSDSTDYNCDGPTVFPDEDGDGYDICTDCDDASEAIHPEAQEVCDAEQTDEDCNGVADDEDSGTSEASKSVTYADADLDGYGDINDTGELACASSEGRVSTQTDCDDSDPDVSPAASEVCDEANVDENCNGLADDADDSTSSLSKTAYYLDADHDGYGRTSGSILYCEDPSSSDDWWTSDHTDCDDQDADIHPDAVELCNAIDDNCADGVDEAGATGAMVWYQDVDDDGFGDESSTTSACKRPSGYVAYLGDCDDYDAAINPDADELCDPTGIDENCNGSSNDQDTTSSAESMQPFYPDSDGDGYGEAGSEASYHCVAPEGYVSKEGDCDDTDPSFNPSATETDCSDSNDYNCDGSIGDSDEDGDGFSACGPEGSADCNDGDADIRPDTDETCDEADVDENCNGKADDDDPDPDADSRSLFYPDADGDGYGDAESDGEYFCDAPDGYVANAGDCDDSVPSIHPDAPELCDDQNVDENCDGFADNDDPGASISTTSVYHPDADQDGYGDSGTLLYACDNPGSSDDSWTQNGDDCDDTSSAIHPEAPEQCNGLDDDCDGDADGSSASEATAWFQDADGDGFGDSSTRTVTCKAPEGYSSQEGDCDDANAEVYPGAVERCDADDVDENCNGLADDEDPSTKEAMKTLYYSDQDGDGFGSETDSGVAYCDEVEGLVTLGGDCDDFDIAYHPGAAEEDCSDPNDYNCDGSTGSQDEDFDGFSACEEAGTGDCDDMNEEINPGQEELCDGWDNDCDGLIDDADPTAKAEEKTTYFKDVDGDGFGDPSTESEYCQDPSSVELLWTTQSDDCDDTLKSVNPSEQEVCNDRDDDCDEDIDESDASDALLYFADNDGDGYGSAFASARGCSQPEDMVGNPEDCDDESADIHPEAAEDCEGLSVDQNCDKFVGCDDPSCGSEEACWDAEICDNGADDDGDGMSDCDDSECADTLTCASNGCTDVELESDRELETYSSTSGHANDLAGSCGGGSAEEVTFSWTAPDDGTYVFSTRGSAFDTVLYLLSEGCGGEELACSDDYGESAVWSGAVMTLSAGETLLVGVDGFGTQNGDFQLNIYATEAFGCDDGEDNDADGDFDCDDQDCEEDASCLMEECEDYEDNDLDGLVDCLDDECDGEEACADFSCPDEEAGSDLPFELEGDSVPAENDQQGSCGGASAEDYSFAWTAPEDGTYTFSTEGSEYDTLLYILDESCDSGVELACNDDVDPEAGRYDSSITLELAAGQTVVVVVDGFETESGEFRVGVSAEKAGD